MQESEAQHFLETHQCPLIQRVRNVDSLVDFLSQPGSSEPSILSKEMASNICAQKTSQEKMREVYKHLNSNRGFELMLKWLQDNEPDLIKELEKSSETDSEAPARKRCRSSAEAVDQTDSGLKTPNLKTLSTFAKLEKWVSTPEKSQQLIKELEKKLAQGEMKALKEKLKNKKLKNSLHLSVTNIKEIYSSQRLTAFFGENRGVKFPDLTIRTFFADYSDESLQNLPSGESDAQKQVQDLHAAQGQNVTHAQTQFKKEDCAPLEGATVDMQETCTAAPSQSTTLSMEVDSLMPSESQQMNCDPDSKFEGNNLPSHKQCGESDVPKQTQSTDTVQGQNGSAVQQECKDKDDTPLEEAMNTQGDLNMHSGEDSFTGKPCAAEPSASVGVAADPMQSEEKTESHTISLSDKVSAPPQTSDVQEQPKTLSVNQRQRSDEDDDYLELHLNTSPGPVDRVEDSLMESEGLHTDTKESSEDEFFVPKKDADAPDSEAKKKQTDGHPSGDTRVFPVEKPNQIMPVVNGQGQAGSFSTPSDDSVKASKKLKGKQRPRESKLKKMNDQHRLLCEWVKKKCPSGSEEEVREVFKCISIENKVEHSEYSSFDTENVILYTDPQTGEKQIIVTDDKNGFLLKYQMWVCGARKAVPINQEDNVIDCDPDFESTTIKKCEKFVLEVFAPTLAVFKNMQREKILHSLIENN